MRPARSRCRTGRPRTMLAGRRGSPGRRELAGQVLREWTARSMSPANSASSSSATQRDLSPMPAPRSPLVVIFTISQPPIIAATMFGLRERELAARVRSSSVGSATGGAAAAAGRSWTSASSAVLLVLLRRVPQAEQLAHELKARMAVLPLDAAQADRRLVQQAPSRPGSNVGGLRRATSGGSSQRRRLPRRSHDLVPSLGLRSRRYRIQCPAHAASPISSSTISRPRASPSGARFACHDG